MTMIKKHCLPNQEPCPVCCDDSSPRFVKPGYFKTSDFCKFPICPNCGGTGIGNIFDSDLVNLFNEKVNVRAHLQDRMYKLVRGEISAENLCELASEIEELEFRFALPLLPEEVVLVQSFTDVWRQLKRPRGVYLEEVKKQIPELLSFVPVHKFSDEHLQKFVIAPEMPDRFHKFTPQILAVIDEMVEAFGMLNEYLDEDILLICDPWKFSFAILKDNDAYTLAIRSGIPNERLIVINLAKGQLFLGEFVDFDELDFCLKYCSLVEYVCGSMDRQTGKRIPIEPKRLFKIKVEEFFAAQGTTFPLSSPDKMEKAKKLFDEPEKLHFQNNCFCHIRDKTIIQYWDETLVSVLAEIGISREDFPKLNPFQQVQVMAMVEKRINQRSDNNALN